MSWLGRLGTGDTLIGLAILALVLAILLPTYRARSFDRLADAVTDDVETLRGAAVAAHRASGTWPAPVDAGVIPEGTRGAFAGDASLARERYSLEWRLLERVEYVETTVAAPATPELDPDEEIDQQALEPADAPPDSATVALVPRARTLGAIVVHAGDDRILARLLAAYGPGDSWVHDTTWTLVIRPAS